MQRLDSFDSFLLLFLFGIGYAAGFSFGVPPTPTICRSMTPNHHGALPQSTPDHCTVKILNETIKNGEQIEVILEVVDQDTSFKGFYIQSREQESLNPIGSFSGEKTDVKTHSCAGIKANAAHHSNANKKKSIKLYWKAPLNYEGTVIFTATCVEDFFKFWTQIKSPPLNILYDPMATAAPVRAPVRVPLINPGGFFRLRNQQPQSQSESQSLGSIERANQTTTMLSLRGLSGIHGSIKKVISNSINGIQETAVNLVNLPFNILKTIVRV